MRFEKLNENKIRITLSNQDLEEKHIDFHSFMSNSLESQDLFFDMLNEAEKEIGFVTKDYRIRIEAFAMSGGDFIVTVTRSLPESEKIPVRKKVKIKRKKANLESAQALYAFRSLEDFYSFLDFLKNHHFSLNQVAKKMALYSYKNTYYFVLQHIVMQEVALKRLFSMITEFGSYIHHSELFIRKLVECGEVVVKNSTIHNFMKISS